ncbi:MAG: GAF domain-containing protein [Magnetococcales bacterium]|nr:GAF domain-containing protein [Magnetococcales bacterium]NGZ05068.1 GAF domain-containing protein [Magnetococcales bacterium]
MSERNEQRVKLAHQQIEQQQKDLQKAHKTLEKHAETLEETVRRRTADLVRTQEKLQKLVELGVSLAQERDIDALLENILLGGKALTHADAGTLYLRTKDDFLRFTIVRTDSLKIAMGGAGHKPVFMPAVPLLKSDGTPNLKNVATYAVNQAETVVIADAYDSHEFDFSGVRQFDRGTGYRSQSFLTVPLKPRQGKVIGVMQLINATDPVTGKVIPFDPEVVTFVEALAAQAAMTLDNQLLLQAQKDLFDAFIRLIAAAIDAKSPYTGGHCERVPELARLLAQAVCDTEHPGFADFTMNEDELQEMRIASWLHDCGKVTTPEYVVDKATKLEGIYNRIHEIRMRFEVLHRDAEIRCLHAMMAEGADRAELQHELAEHQARLQEEFAFIARANVGGEFMTPADKERVRSLAQRTWMRYFDDSLGLSHMEMKRRTGVSQPLPVAEALLADKSEHIVPRERDTRERDRLLGIQMPVPEHLYNMGEVYNLCIERGTLTFEERYKINEHVVQTLAMLENLPFPDTMKRVPEFAGAHHETMLGTGYPRKLQREQMSVPARIMAIADVFEALTATDRPYKEPKTLSQAIKIMGFMKKDGHIDPDLFEIFLKSGVYRQYADKFLDPRQIDDVEIAPYLTVVAG